MTDHSCPCGSQKKFSACCEPYLNLSIYPTTPKALMCSRYTAYSLANIDYIKATMCKKAIEGFNEHEATEWAKSVKWTGLTVFFASPLSKNNTQGFVFFKASYNDGTPQFICEYSEFEKINGRWFYINGRSPRLNEACPCRSGKKAKRCCLS